MRHYLSLLLMLLYIPVSCIVATIITSSVQLSVKRGGQNIPGKNLASSMELLLARYISIAGSVSIHRSAYRDLYTWSNLITRYAWITRHRVCHEGINIRRCPGLLILKKINHCLVSAWKNYLLTYLAVHQRQRSVLGATLIFATR